LRRLDLTNNRIYSLQEHAFTNIQRSVDQFDIAGTVHCKHAFTNIQRSVDQFDIAGTVYTVNPPSPTYRGA
jgi:hypothetical protein